MNHARYNGISFDTGQLSAMMAGTYVEIIDQLLHVSGEPGLLAESSNDG